jgi:NitT/TauT family transport system substrate-binding protein
MITDVLALKQSMIAKDPQLVVALIRGTLDGLDYMHREPEKAAALIGKALGIGVADVKSQLANVENPPLNQLGDVFRKSASLPSFYASGSLIGDILKKEGQIQVLPPIEATYDASFVAALQAHPGDPR